MHVRTLFVDCTFMSMTLSGLLKNLWRTRYLGVYERYIRPMILNSPELPELNSPAECRLFREQLLSRQAQLIDGIMQELPMVRMSEAAHNMITQRKAELNQQIEELNKAMQGMDSQLKRLVAELYDLEQPSLTKCFRNEILRDKSKSVTRKIRDVASAYAGSWLQPDVVLEILKASGLP